MTQKPPRRRRRTSSTVPLPTPEETMEQITREHREKLAALAKAEERT